MGAVSVPISLMNSGARGEEETGAVSAAREMGIRTALRWVMGVRIDPAEWHQGARLPRK